RERVAVAEEVVHARGPERLEVEEMAGVLLRGPLVAGLAGQRGARHPAHDLLEARWSTAQADAESRGLLDREREVELAFDPGRNARHASERNLIRPAALNTAPAA